MNFSAFSARTGSPSIGSRSGSPVRLARRTIDDAVPKNDKATRRYASIIERTLATWEIAPEEWADYIAFLSRLLKAIQSGPTTSSSLPHSGAIASKLAQCLNPGLPSGVHQKALEIYAYIFSTFGKDHISSQLHEYLPGLFPLLSFAALSVRPALYDILEDYVVCLPPAQLRPVLKSFILCILPALEDESSEDFDRALTTVTRLEHTFLRGDHHGDYASFYWQSVFLSVITSPSRRHGALNYLIRRLPKFTQSATTSSDATFTAEAEAVVSPEPGLLIRAFACGLSDPQMLVQRGFLDALTTHLPLDSTLLQQRVEAKDFQLLLTSTMSVLLRRDMSLNRRIWQWFLGPELKEDTAEHATATKQLEYIAEYGISGIETSLLRAFSTNAPRPSERVKPFRIGLSLMDRWEIGGSTTPKIFLPALTCAFRYTKQAAPAEMTEFLKSAKLFFDGVESKMIWSKLYLLLVDDTVDAVANLQLFQWTLNTFNVREEEMTTIHAPLLTLCTLNHLQQTTGDSAITSLRFTILNTLINIISHKAFSITGLAQATQDVSVDKSNSDIQVYYSDIEDNDSAPYSDQIIGRLLLRRALDVLKNTTGADNSANLSKAVNVYLQLLHKGLAPDEASITELLDCLESHVSLAISDTSIEMLSAIIPLLDALATLSQADRTHAAFLRLEAHISPVLLKNISPQRPKFNVEAVRLLWRIDSLLEGECSIQASVQALVTDSNTKSRKTSLRTFLNLWNLSVAQQISSAKSPVPGLTRRISGAVIMPEHDKGVSKAHALSEALLAALETLSEPTDVAFDDVNVWLNSSIHTESALLMLFERLRDALNVDREQKTSRNAKQVARRHNDAARALVYMLGHFNNILQHAQLTLWTTLSGTQLPGSKLDTTHPALTALVEQCLMLLPGDDEHDADVHFLAVSILDRILSAPASIQAAVRVPEFGTIVTQRVLACMSKNGLQMQSSLLDLSAKALIWQRTFAQALTASKGTNHARKPSIDELPVPVIPVHLLIQMLKDGFSRSSCIPYLDAWLRFTEEVLPMIGSAITSVLIPLTEIICAQVDFVFSRMMDFSATSTNSDIFAPEATISKLLDSLAMFLQAAHNVLLQDEAEPETTPLESSTVLSSMTPNLFKSQGPPSKMAKANSRLTAILASKDVARVCIKIWLWTTSSAEGTNVDRQSAATTSYYALRLRNRARHMLEELFSLEPLESLEVVVARWVISDTQTQKESVISLLHVLRDLRPKNTVPAILDALCSRTNPALLVPSRQSTLTSDLTSADLVLFYSAYLASLEDDALEEVWSDCNAFLRDVLSNPMPHRQVLPALIWIVYQMAHKLENTNYGDRKRMRRELGDNFQRLLAASFAALPSGSTEPEDPLEQETAFSTGLRDMNLVVILREIIGRADLILETSDRVAVCINTVSTSLITPTLRSKTFPARINADILALILRVAKKSPGAKIWRKDISDAFNDARFTTISPKLVEQYWFPILQQWSLTDKERMNELIGRLYAPSGAGIMFGVGASAARLDADRKTQLNLRRISLLLMASPIDSHVEHLKTIQEKMVELFEASTTSSPSSAIKAELFMLVRALLLSTSAVHFAPLWPIVNDNLQSALISMDADSSQVVAQNNLSLLQACKLLDLLAAITPDEFQLYEWIYLTNTTDAVYHQPDWHPAALSDILGVSRGGQPPEDAEDKETSNISTNVSHDTRSPVLVKGAGYDTEDIKAMAAETFMNTALRPFLSQMSINLYESRYRMDTVDVSAFRHVLIDDLQDSGTTVS